MPSKLPWFPFYPSDFIMDEKVSSMSAMECGAYMRLLCFAWSSQAKGTLEARPEHLARMATLSDEEWAEHEAKIMAPFTLIDGRWHQKRMMEEGAASEEKHKIFSEAGRRGAQAKATLKPPLSLASATQSQSQHIKEEKIAASAKPTQPTRRKILVCNDEFLKELKATGAYEGIDLDQELRKMNAWLLSPNGRGKKPTQQRFINWINKCDRPMDRRPERFGPAARPHRYINDEPQSVSDDEWKRSAELVREQTAKLKASLNGNAPL